VTPHATEWLHLLLRWFHIMAGIMWIGNSFFFMWLDRAFEPPKTPREGVTGETWMVHGGGYYAVERRKFEPGKLPPTLHWFKWEATLTWISGFFLLLVVYYASDAALLMDKHLGVSRQTAMLVGLLSLPAAWLVYDLLWKSPLGSSVAVAGTLSLALLGGLSYGLTRFLSARAAFIHTGAVLGTLMVLNVWIRILPQQGRMLDAMRDGRSVDPAPGKEAKKRSTHNSYMTLGVVFIMISNHFSIVGYKWNWIALLAMMAAGAGLRHFMLEPEAKNAWLVALAAGVLVALYGATRPPPRAAGVKPGVSANGVQPSAPAGKPIDQASAGSIRGSVAFTGQPPEPKEVALPGDCAAQRRTPALDNTLLASGGKLQGAIVHVSAGAEGWQPPPAPTAAVVLDQQGCMYEPRVVALRVGQTLAITNSDALMHNVHGIGADNGSFNEPMLAGSPRIERAFATPEIVNMQCDVHPWMGARVGVFDHPWFAVTGVDGSFQLAGLPPGTYTVTAWHETLGEKTVTVTVAARAAAQADFGFP